MTNEELIQSIQNHIDSGVGEYERYGLTLDECRQVIKALEEQPNSLEQIKWERDTAINQLKELGYGFGEKIEKCEDCISRKAAKVSIQRKIDEVVSKDGSYDYGMKQYIGGLLTAKIAISRNNLPSVTPQPCK